MSISCGILESFLYATAGFMRISDLSRASGVPVATIRFYLRERLLPPGRLTARNQARYDESHVARLRLIRTLTGVGQLSLSSVREVLTAIDNKRLSVQGLCEVVNRALFAEPPAAAEAVEGGTARDQVDEFIDGLGWRVGIGAPGRATLTHVLTALRHLGRDVEIGVLQPYARAAGELATREADLIPADNAGPAVDAVTLVARTVLFEVAFAALRRMAHDHYLAVRFGEEGTVR